MNTARHGKLFALAALLAAALLWPLAGMAQTMTGDNMAYPSITPTATAPTPTMTPTPTAAPAPDGTAACSTEETIDPGCDADISGQLALDISQQNQNAAECFYSDSYSSGTSSTDSCIQGVIAEALGELVTRAIYEECGVEVSTCGTPPTQTVQYRPIDRRPAAPVLTRTELASILRYIGDLDTSIFYRRDNPLTATLAPTESEALRNQMRAILATIRADINGRPGRRLTTTDAQNFMSQLKSKCTDLKNAVNDDGRKAKIQGWIDSLDTARTQNSFGTISRPR